MDRRVRWTAEAERWLREIHDYIARDSPAAATRIVRGIYDRAEALANFPDRGYRYEGRPDDPVRLLLYGHYRIAYRVTDEAVDILGIFHGALDLERLL